MAKALPQEEVANSKHPNAYEIILSGADRAVAVTASNTTRQSLAIINIPCRVTDPVQLDKSRDWKFAVYPDISQAHGRDPEGMMRAALLKDGQKNIMIGKLKVAK